MTYNWPLATYEWLVPGKLRGALERLLLAEVVQKALTSIFQAER